MRNLTFTLEETIPFYDSNWVIMQMANMRFAVTWTQEDNQTLEEFKEWIQKEFESQRDYVAGLTPTIKAKQEKMNKILNEFKSLYPEDTKRILSKYK